MIKWQRFKINPLESPMCHMPVCLFSRKSPSPAQEMVIFRSISDRFCGAKELGNGKYLQNEAKWSKISSRAGPLGRDGPGCLARQPGQAGSAFMLLLDIKSSALIKTWSPCPTCPGGSAPRKHFYSLIPPIIFTPSEMSLCEQCFAATQSP